MRRLPGFLLAVCGWSAFALPAAAELYKYVDKDGRTIYSDQPPPPGVKDFKARKFGDGLGGPADDLPFSIREAAKRNPVTLYASACGEPCDLARKLLGGRGIPFTERNPEVDPASQEALKKLIGDLQVPVLVIGEDAQRGFSDESWHAALTAAGYPRNFSPRAKPTDSPPAAKAAKAEETVTPVTPAAPKKK